MTKKGHFPIDRREAITLVFNSPDDFSIDGVKQSETNKMQHLCVKTIRDYGTAYINIQRIVKQSPSSKSYILNTAEYPVFLDYIIENKELGTETKVGPTSDAIIPGQFKEIGAGPGVIWRISRA